MITYFFIIMSTTCARQFLLPRLICFLMPLILSTPVYNLLYKLVKIFLNFLDVSIIINRYSMTVLTHYVYVYVRAYVCVCVSVCVCKGIRQGEVPHRRWVGGCASPGIRVREGKVFHLSLSLISCDLSLLSYLSYLL